jgi:protein ImuB
MYWIALWPSVESERTAWGWWALRFTPRVAQVEGALLLEVSASERLFGGRERLQRLLLEENEALARSHWAQGATSSIAMALLRARLQGLPLPQLLPQDLPLHLLTAAREHVPTLERTGCRTWGQLRALPRSGVARRFGAELLAALDAAYGERPERFPWLTLPDTFDLAIELPMLATSAPELMEGALHLLRQLQVWLQARHRGVLGLALEWTLDLRRLNGVRLPRHEQLAVRTAQPTQDMAHLRKLVGEHLQRAALSAPANHLRLRSLETVPWAGAPASLLPEDNVQGEKLHQLVERLSVRLGEDNVVVPVVCEDHRPERMQQWRPARSGPLPVGERAVVRGGGTSDALYPTWLLPQPQRLEMRGDQPCHGGAPLRLLGRLYRVETGWWEEAGPALRDYFFARSPQAGLVWVYRERLSSHPKPRWYLQGLYA